MNLFKKILSSFLNSAAVSLYVALVAWVMTNVEHRFDGMPSIFGPVAILLLFVLSAAIVPTLIFGWPIYLLFINDKKEALIRLALNLGWLFVITAIIFIFLIF